MCHPYIDSRVVRHSLPPYTHPPPFRRHSATLPASVSSSVKRILLTDLYPKLLAHTSVTRLYTPLLPPPSLPSTPRGWIAGDGRKRRRVLWISDRTWPWGRITRTLKFCWPPPPPPLLCTLRSRVPTAVAGE